MDDLGDHDHVPSNELHAQILKLGTQISKPNRISPSSSLSMLIDMYAKSGCIESARRVFGDVIHRDVFVWTAMISALASHGQCREAIDLFVEMENSELKPDERTMTAVLSACRNAGLVHEGFMFLYNMRKQYGIRATVQHYGCMVDLLARAGRLKEAEDFINKMPIRPDAVLWRNLVWACKVRGDTDRAECLMKHLNVLEKDADDSGSYILAPCVCIIGKIA